MKHINKIAILIDGGYFIPRYYQNYGAFPKKEQLSEYIENTILKVQTLTGEHSQDVLFRVFYYDCRPYGGTEEDPTGKKINFSNTPAFKAATRFQNDLRIVPQMALRLGDLSFDGWKFKKGTTDEYIPDFKQKSVDMKIGLDIAWIAGKKTVDKIVLVAGDSDFVTPMKLARREGLLVYLDTMNQSRVKIELKEHADFLL